jgi:hypothetical protein
VWRRGVGIPTRSIVIEPRHYCFVETRRIVEPHVDRFAAPPARNVTIIRNTTNVTNYTVVNDRIANRSVREETVERATGRPLPRYPVAEVESASPRAFHARPESDERSPSVSVREAPPVERTNTERIRDERDRERRREELERSREAAHQRDADRQREALQRQEIERHGQELRRPEDLSRSREAAHQETMRGEQIEREGAAHRAREDAMRRPQAEAQHPAAPQPLAPQPQRQPPSRTVPQAHAVPQPPQRPALPFGAGQAPAGHD